MHLNFVLQLADESRKTSRRPFAAALVNRNGSVVICSKDMRDELYDPTAHPETYVIRQYCQEHKIMHLVGYTLYTNVEPCSMCSGAIRSARISTVVYSVPQRTLRALSGGTTIIDSKDILSHSKGKVEIIGPLLLEKGVKILEKFEF